MGELFLEIKSRPHLMVAYGANLFLSFHYFATTYINSSYLNINHVSESATSILYAIAALINIVIFFFAPAILDVLGSYRQILYFIVLNFIASITMALSGDRALIMVAFVVHQAMTLSIAYAIDLFAEKGVSKKFVGELRGVFLTISNITLVVAPTLIGTLAMTGDFSTIYLLASILLIPVLLLAGVGFKNTVKSAYRPFDIKKTFGLFMLNKDIRGVFGANVLLQFFYTWMVIYMPLYFINEMGMNWNSFGHLLSVALLAFLIIEFPASVLADRKIGEQEMMILGFIIIASAMLALPFLPVSNIYILMMVFFGSRVGAALIETTTESYFFKKIDGDGDADLVALFRMAPPISYFLGALSGGAVIAALSYLSLPFGYIFIVLAVIMLAGTYFASSITDTR